MFNFAYRWKCSRKILEEAAGAEESIGKCKVISNHCAVCIRSSMWAVKVFLRLFGTATVTNTLKKDLCVDSMLWASRTIIDDGNFTTNLFLNGWMKNLLIRGFIEFRERGIVNLFRVIHLSHTHCAAVVDGRNAIQFHFILNFHHFFIIHAVCCMCSRTSIKIGFSVYCICAVVCYDCFKSVEIACSCGLLFYDERYPKKKL